MIAPPGLRTGTYRRNTAASAFARVEVHRDRHDPYGGYAALGHLLRDYGRAEFDVLHLVRQRLLFPFARS